MNNGGYIEQSELGSDGIFAWTKISRSTSTNGCIQSPSSSCIFRFSSSDFVRDSRLSPDDIHEFSAAVRKFETITIIVGGTTFHVPLDLLHRYPHTKLGRLAEYHTSPRSHNNSQQNTVYRFSRHPAVFQTVLDYFATGELHYPLNICGVIVQRELIFWDIPALAVQPCCLTQYSSYIDRKAVLTKFNGHLLKCNSSYVEEGYGWKQLRSRVWRFMVEPTSSKGALLYTAVWFLLVLINIVCFCLETMDVGEYQLNITIKCNDNEPVVNKTINKALTSLRIIDFISALLFTGEFIVRFTICPHKKKFLLDPITYIDSLALIPSYIYFILFNMNGFCYYRYINEIELIMFLRVLRAFRVTYILRYYGPFHILVHALRISIHELLMLAAFLTISVLIFGTMIFYLERTDVYLNESKMFPDIPSGLWWAIVTMTTLGYGDKLPKTPLGYTVGAAAAVTGILIVALAVPIVSNNFCKLYDFYNSKRLLDTKIKQDKDFFTIFKNSSVETLEHEIKISSL